MCLSVFMEAFFSLNSSILESHTYHKPDSTSCLMTNIFYKIQNIHLKVFCIVLH